MYMLADPCEGAQHPLINVWAPLAMSSGGKKRQIYKKGNYHTDIAEKSS